MFWQLLGLSDKFCRRMYTMKNEDGARYMIYTPSDPLLFVAVKDQNGILQIADDDLLEDPAIEEESALLDSLLGKRSLRH
ncbi:BTB/POZ domain-containing protein TNFAIP1 isoform 2 [Quillaja saponaria]|uniref:BTB/POZ domain-containing protein TNFAIP1 isoform 2 n=1 Tax=Quillaja saponaria TaxID=32244 RepID=A0AAD7LGQ0_QUISA|nr:BTB/POZ domain-containing protein TNFAIP1 isoform 2 [Quillaja saponaria]